MEANIHQKYGKKNNGYMDSVEEDCMIHKIEWEKGIMATNETYLLFEENNVGDMVFVSCTFMEELPKSV